MKKFAAVCVLVFGFAAPAASQQAKIHRVGFVSASVPLVAENPSLQSFRSALRALGYIEGKNVVIDYRSAEGRPERYPGIFAELMGLKADVLVVASVVGALEAKKATIAVPVVFAGVLDAVGPGIVSSLARPGGNITGTTFGVAGSNIAGKWVELLKEAVPRVSRIAVLSNSADPQTALLVRDIETAASVLKVKTERFDVVGYEGSLDKALVALGASAANGMIVVNSILFSANHPRLVQFAAQKRIPAIYFFNQFTDNGGFMSYGGNLEDSYRRAATLVDKVLKGAKAGDLPIDQATRFELVFNLKAARALGIAIPQSPLLRADRVIE